MIVTIWVFFMLGDPTPSEPGLAYVQQTASAYAHDHEDLRVGVEATCKKQFHRKYPSHQITECGWKRQEVRVMGE